MVKNRGLCFFKAKNAKKVKITSVFAELSRTPPDPKIKINVTITIFLCMWIFQIRFQKKVIASQRQVGPFWPPP